MLHSMRVPAAGRPRLVLALLLLCCLQQLLPGSCDDSATPAAAQSSPKSLAQPDYSLYLRKTDLLARVREVVGKHPDIMKYETRHAKDEDYKADVMVVTVEPAGLSPTHKSKARLLMDFGEHGREFITSEVGLKFLEVLGDAQQLSQLVGGGRRAARLQTILQHCAFKILPMENTAGRDLVEAGNLCERKNGRGVDPNRNWDIDWGVKEKDYDPKEEYPGRAPLSEPEVQVLLSLAKELKPHVWLNVHSGMFALFTPYDHKGHVPNTTDARAALRMMKRIQDTVCPQCKIGSGGHTVGYLAHGTATDYMYEVLKVPMSFTWEIFGDESASYEDCFRMFNPLGKEFGEVSLLWVKALLHLTELLPTHPATWPIFKPLGLERWEKVAPPGNATQQSPAAGTAVGPVPPAAAAAAGSKAAASPEPVALLPDDPAVEKVQQQQQQQQQQPATQQQQPATQQQQPATQQQQPSPEVQQQQQQLPASQQQQQQQAKQADTAAVPAAQQQPAGVTPSDADSSSTDVNIVEELKGSSHTAAGHDLVLVRINKVLPWALGVAGFVGLLYVVTRDRGASYNRLPTRQPGGIPARR